MFLKLKGFFTRSPETRGDTPPESERVKMGRTELFGLSIRFVTLLFSNASCLFAFQALSVLHPT